MKSSIRTPLPALLLGLALLPLGAQAAQETKDAPAFSFTSNVGLFSQYVFRGVSYSQKKPVVQGGMDVVHGSGFYAGVWGTALSSKAIQNASGEIDLYGGYAGSAGDIGYDVGLLQFTFPGGRYNGSNESYNTLEAYASVSYKGLKLKYSHTLGDYFGYNDQSFGAAGNGDSKGSHYLEANFAYDVRPGWSLDLHVGRQTVRNYRDYDFTDYRVGLAHDLGSGWRASLAWIGTNADSALYTIDGVDTGRSKWLASIMRSF